MDEYSHPEDVMKKPEEKLSELIGSGKDIIVILSAFGIDSSSLPSAVTVLFSLFLSLVRVLMEKLGRFKEKAEDLKDEVKRLNGKVIDMKSSRDPETSSTPASKASIGAKLRKQDRDRSLRKPSGRKAGGQVGHQGHGLKKDDINADITEVVNHYPAHCMACSKFEECKTMMKCISTGHVYEFKTVMYDNIHKTYTVMCPMMNELLEGEKPAEVKSSQQYGFSIRGFVIDQWTVGITSIDRICEIARTFLNISISPATVMSILDDFSHRSQPVLDAIREYLISAAVKHADETGMSVDSTLYWLHTVCDRNATYLYADHKRGFDAISNEGLLPDASGILIHDCFSPYFSLENLLHAICLQHIQRELEKNGKHGHKEYFDRFEKFLLEMRQAKLDAIEQGRDSLEAEVIESFRTRFRKLIDEGLRKIKKPKRRRNIGKIPEGPERSLLLRLQKYEDCVFLFLENFDVEYSNNAAELSVRGAKVRQSVSKCFRTPEGLDMFARISSVLDTAVKLKIPRDKTINAILDGTAGDMFRAALAM